MCPSLNSDAKYWLEFKKKKTYLLDHLLLTKKVTWTMHGLMLPTDVKRQKTKPVLSRRMKTLAQKTSVRILVFKNGLGQDGHEITVGKETMRKVTVLKLNYESNFKVYVVWCILTLNNWNIKKALHINWSIHLFRSVLIALTTWIILTKLWHLFDQHSWPFF